MAQAHFARGAHGIYIFNWHANSTTRRESLSTIGSPESLQGLDKAYTSVHRLIGSNPLRKDSERDDRIYGEVPVELHRTLTGNGLIGHVATHDAEPASAQLLVEMAHFSPTGDEVAVRLDDVDLGPPDVRNHAAENPSTPSDVDENSWLVWDLDVAQAAPATHRIEVVLVQRDRRIRPPLEVANVEMWTRCN